MFFSNLPLVVIDTFGENPKPESEWNAALGYNVPVPYDPYVSGTISIIDNKYKLNSLMDKPAIASNIKIRMRGNSSLGYEKKQYLVKFVTSDGSKNKQNVLQMGEDWEWIINISMIDKSLLRNYMGLNFGGELIPNTPDVRYCEVLFKQGQSYSYKGVYLITESIKQGPNRVAIADYDSRYPEASYLLRRDRYDPAGNMLTTYGTVNKLTTGHLDVKYPNQSEIKSHTKQAIEEEISALERALFAEQPSEFLSYHNYINVESFIDYFIINELFGNYEGGVNSTYMYKNVGNKISMGPFWDFDRSIDNYNNMQMKIESTALHDAPWFHQLLRDKKFVDQLILRYHSLRKTLLAEKNIIDYIDQTILFLGPAQKRDWNQWKYYYTANYLVDEITADGTVAYRDTQTYEDEIEKIKKTIIEHGRWLDENIDSLYQFSHVDEVIVEKNLLNRVLIILLGENVNVWGGQIMAVLYLLAFTLSIIIAQREQ